MGSMPSPDRRHLARDRGAKQTDPVQDRCNGEEHAMSRLCEGRVAIVTGAGRGLGREHALLLAAHGAKVVVNDIGAGIDGTGRNASLAGEVVAMIEKAGGEAIANGEDVSDWNGAKAMIDAAVKTFGKLDILINNAGIL